MEKIIEILSGLRPEYDFKESNDFIEDWYFDSFDIVLLVSELETTFDVTIDGLDVIPENFANVDSIEKMIVKNGGKLW